MLKAFYQETFNSLYEILYFHPMLILSQVSLFQFSLWDSRKRSSKKGSWRQTYLSILFMRFTYYINYSAQDGVFFQFSLWDSKWEGGEEKWKRKWTFNSLYEILKDTSSSRRLYVTSFQFSLWDSYDKARLVTFFDKEFLSILFMRFTDRRLFCQHRQANHFQFSLWDSEGFSCSVYLSGLISYLSLMVLLRWLLICF